MDLDPKQTQRAFTGPQVCGVMPEVEREIGYLAVTGDPSLELTPVADKLKGLTPVDEEEIPLKFRQLPPSVASQIGRQTVPILFAFRYLQHPYELALNSVRHEEAEVVTAVVESCKLDTTLTREGSRITALIAQVRSRYQPFFEIRLPKKAQLWHALVNGVRVRPLTEQTAEGEVTKVPIAQVQGVRGPVRVELQVGGGRQPRSWAASGRSPGRAVPAGHAHPAARLGAAAPARIPRGQLLRHAPAAAGRELLRARRCGASSRPPSRRPPPACAPAAGATAAGGHAAGEQHLAVMAGPGAAARWPSPCRPSSPASRNCPSTSSSRA